MCAIAPGICEKPFNEAKCCADEEITIFMGNVTSGKRQYSIDGIVQNAIVVARLQLRRKRKEHERIRHRSTLDSSVIVAREYLLMMALKMWVDFQIARLAFS